LFSENPFTGFGSQQTFSYGNTERNQTTEKIRFAKKANIKRRSSTTSEEDNKRGFEPEKKKILFIPCIKMKRLCLLQPKTL